jgi:hypothetical protein
VHDFNLVLEPGLTVEGSVRLAEGEKEPLPAGMWVGHEPVERVRTDGDKNVQVAPDGEFRLEGRRPGEYWPFAFKLPAAYQVTDIRYGSTSVLGGSFRPGTALGAGKLEFIISSRLGSVLGSVRDADGNPVAGATVVLVPFPMPEKLSPYVHRKTVSAEQGSFAFNGIPPGTYMALVLLGEEARQDRDPELLRQKASKAGSFQVEAGKVANPSIPSIKP